MKYSLVILSLFMSGLCKSQTDSLAMTHFNLKISYNTSIIYPGAGAGIEYIIREKEKLKRNGSKRRTGEFISGNLAFYHHPTFHDNIYFTSEWGKRRIKTNGFCYEFSAGPGFSRTFISGTTYKVDDAGNISKVRLAGYYYAIITMGSGAGYDFSVKKGLPFAALVKMNFLFMFPYNSTIYIRPVIELGFRYHIKNEFR